MTQKLIIIAVLFALTGSFAVAQDLKIEYQVNVAAADAGNYFSFIGPIRYMSALKDTVDATTGASKLNSTENFNPYIYDVKGKATFPSGLRGLFLFAVAPAGQRTTDNLSATKAGDGKITIRYTHRGTAYEIVTDGSGKLSFPDNACRRRPIGFIQGEGPQVLHRDFSSDGTAAKVDWSKVWDAGVAGGKEIKAGVATKTGTITPDGSASDSMYTWQGSLQFTLERNILKVVGGLNAVKR
jgi:hypothetical protein